jgi:nitrogen-specific signal transduction histidine kinase
MASSKAGGSGLGLAITQQILHQHGGKLEAENREEGGARVRLFLPAAPPGQDKGQAATVPGTFRDGTGFPGEGARA